MLKLNTLHSRILISIISIVVTFLLIITFFIVTDVKKDLSEVYDNNALNLLNATLRIVKSEYKNIQYHKRFTLQNRKNEIKNVTFIAYQIIKAAYLDYKKGLISEKEAKKRVIRDVRNLRYGENNIGYFWINKDSIPTVMLSHGLFPQYEGKVLDAPKFYCTIGKKEYLFKAFHDVCAKKGEGFVEYLWPKPIPGKKGVTEQQPKIGFVKLFKPWGWIVGTGVYIDDIEREVQKRIDLVIKDLNKLISEQKIGKTGYFFIFNSKNEMLVHPTLAGKNVGDLIDPKTNQKLFDEFKQVVSDKKIGTMLYLWDKPNDRNNYIYLKKAFIVRYKPLDWYIVSSIYIDDFNKPISGLIFRISIFAVILIIFSVFMAVLISKTLTSSLNNLIDFVQTTDENGIPTGKVSVAGTIETKTLANIINNMIVSINKSQEKLQQQRDFSQNIINSSPGIVCGIDSKGLIKFINPSGERIIGLEKEQIIGQKWADIFCNTNTSLKLCNELVNNNFIDEELTFKNKKGELVTLLWSCYINENDTNLEIQILLFATDITELKQAEIKRLELEEKLSHRNKMDAIGQLAGGVAHDFNNMLTGIIGAAEILKLNKESYSENDIKLIESIINASNRAAELTSKLLSFGRKGKVISNLLSIKTVIEDAVDILKSTVNKKVTIKITNHAKTDKVVGDKSELQNIFINMGINSSYAMPDGGLLSFEIYNIHLDENYCESSPFNIRPGNYVKIEVRDEGYGISPENMKKIFEPFFTTKKQGEGTGLGLSAVYGTVENHNGAIEVYSELGVGTVFYIFLPVAAGDYEYKNDLNDIHDVLHGSGKILLVDDEDLLRNTAKRMLNELGYEVILAENGLDAVKIFEKKKEEIDLIITDVLMPVMTGKEAFYKFKEIDPEIKVIVSSGFVKDENIDEMKDLNLSGFISKPFNIIELSHLIYKVLNS
jgi:PAS domain S-box-containing protein